MSACTSSGGETPASGSSDLKLTERAFAAETNGEGVATFSFTINPGETSFQLVGETSTGTMALTSLTGPNGELVGSGSSANLSDSLTASNNSIVFTAPLLTNSITSGQYTGKVLVLKTKTRVIPGANVDFKLFTKQDGTPTSGVLAVNMVLVGAVGDSVDTRSALEEAVDYWKIIYERAGIALDVQWYDFAGPSKVPNPRRGDPFYTQVSSAVRQGAVNVVVGVEVANTTSIDEKFGTYGSSPGSAAPGPHSAVALSIYEITGRDGKFDFTGIDGKQIHNDEKRLAAEETVQLVSHYLGLRHTVEFRGNGGTNSVVSGSDLLSDTDSCITVIGCRAEDLVRSNIMFPYPLQKNRKDLLSDYDGKNRREFYAREAITDQQRTVLNSSIFVQ